MKGVQRRKKNALFTDFVLYLQITLKTIQNKNNKKYKAKFFCVLGGVFHEKCVNMAWAESNR